MIYLALLLKVHFRVYIPKNINELNKFLKYRPINILKIHSCDDGVTHSCILFKNNNYCISCNGPAKNERVASYYNPFKDTGIIQNWFNSKYMCTLIIANAFAMYKNF